MGIAFLPGNKKTILAQVTRDEPDEIRALCYQLKARSSV
jgi:hypothetical protein